MRTYGQHCAVARALDVIGDRWSLLIVRELLVRDCRFLELRRGLPGVASNLLAERLRDLEAGEVVETTTADGITRYRLTHRGRALAPVVRELARWGAPAMLAGPGPDSEQGRWLLTAADALLDGATFRGPNPLLLQFHAEGEPVWLRLNPAAPVEVGLGHQPDADVTITGTLHQCLAALLGLPGGADTHLIGHTGRLSELTTFRTPDDQN
jgi:DNA-binding HxlR family transcriptional regulator